MEIDLKSLNNRQRQAVTHDSGPLLIVAGAGTGKTTVITQRIGYLIQQGKCRADEVLALTFTDKAAGEMEERLDKLMPYGYVDLWIYTFHAFAERILKENALEIGVPNNFKLLSQTEQWLLVRKNLDRFELNFYRPLGNPTKFIHALIKLFSRLKDETLEPQDYLKYAQDLKLNADSADFIKDLIDPQDYKMLDKKERKEFLAQEISKAQEIANAYHIYQQLLLENESLDFGDLINYCIKLLKERPAVLARYRRQFKYILVDEFQDTNYAQYELIKLLAQPKNNVTVVGDDDQSIYKFRGASVSNILEFKKDYPKSKEIFLNDNYRSAQEILDLSYKFIQQNNPNRLEVKLAKIKKGKKEGEILSKKLIAQTKESALISHLAFETADDEIRGVLKQIVDLKAKDKDALWSDFAILSRTNDAANSFVQALSMTKIPFQFLASRGLYGKPVILDLLAYLKLLDNYHEGPAMYRVLNFSIFKLEPHEVNALTSMASRKGYSIYQALQNAILLAGTELETLEKLKRIAGLIEKHSRLALTKNPSEVVMAFLEDSGYLANLTKNDSFDSQQAISHLNQIYRKIKDFEGSFVDKSLKNFLELIELELEAGEAGSLENNFDEGPDSVKVMTIHASKGLEFKYVFIVNMVERRFPSSERRDPIVIPDKLVKEILPEGDVHLQEERRLFYVACTRAKIGLFFTSAYDYGLVRRKKLSPFLIELSALGFPIQDSAQKKTQGIKGEKTEDIGQEIEVCEELIAPMPEYFSFSQLKAFETCPYQYRFAHILRVPVRGKAPFSFGKSIHATLQQFFIKALERIQTIQTDLFNQKLAKGDKKAPVGLEELLEIYESCWIDDWFTSRSEHDEYKQKGKKALMEYYKLIENNFPTPKAMEMPFTLRLESDGEEYGIKGVIDRVDEVSGGVEIIDYKTGAGKNPKNLSAEDKEQLLIYQLACQQLLAEPVKKLTFYNIEPGTFATFVGTDKEIEKVKEKIIKIINQIRLGKFLPKPGMMCQYCDFKNICEHKEI